MCTINFRLRLKTNVQANFSRKDLPPVSRIIFMWRCWNMFFGSKFASDIWQVRASGRNCKDFMFACAWVCYLNKLCCGEIIIEVFLKLIFFHFIINIFQFIWSEHLHRYILLALPDPLSKLFFIFIIILYN